jgi:hypothetical protein
MISPLPKLWVLRYIDSSIIIDKSKINQLQVSHKTKGSGQAEQVRLNTKVRYGCRPSRPGDLQLFQTGPEPVLISLTGEFP